MRKDAFMKKLLKLLTGLLVLVGIIVVIIFSQMNTLVKMAIEHYGSTIAGVTVAVGAADISTRTGEGSLTSFSIHNPDGFKADHAFAAQRISMTLDESSLNTDQVIVTEMTIESPKINYEVAGKGNNFQVIRDHIKKHLAETSKQGYESELDKKQVIINDFYIKNGTINVTAPSVSSQSYHVVLPDIHMHHLGKNQGPGNVPLIMEQIMNVITQDVMNAVGQVTLENFGKMLLQGGISNPLNDVQKTLEGVGQGIQNILPK
jgi:uncharacterized protein involved in outer membrane biogenesis